MADLDAVWERLRAVRHEIHGSMVMRARPLEELRAEEAELVRTLGAVKAGDTIGLKNGLAFIISSIGDSQPHQAELMARKLMHDQCQLKESKARRKREPAKGPPYARPCGKAPKGKAWCAETGAWVDAPAA